MSCEKIKTFFAGTILDYILAQIWDFFETEFYIYIPDSELTVENIDTTAFLADSIIAGLIALEA